MVTLAVYGICPFKGEATIYCQPDAAMRDKNLLTDLSIQEGLKQTNKLKRENNQNLRIVVPWLNGGRIKILNVQINN